MHTILITIAGPGRSVDLEVPAEIPISNLLPTLLDICGPESTQPAPQNSLLWATWGLRPLESTQSLAPNRSLIEVGVLDGAVLLLENIEAADQRKPTMQFVPKTVQQEPGGIGVTWGKGLLS